MSEKQSKFRYIYNLGQAYFYIENGVKPIEPPHQHQVTHKIYFTFDEDETRGVYDKWCSRNKQ